MHTYMHACMQAGRQAYIPFLLTDLFDYMYAYMHTYLVDGIIVQAVNSDCIRATCVPSNDLSLVVHDYCIMD